MLSKATYRTLTDIQNSILLLQALNPKFRQFYEGTLSEYEQFELISIVKPNLDFRRFQIYSDYIKYTPHESYCKAEIMHLAKIMKQNTTLEQQAVNDWTLKNQSVYLNDVFGMSMKDNHKDNTPTHFYLHGLNEYLEKKEFIAILNFCSIMSILYYNEYYLPITERRIPDPKEYYYVPPNPAGDLEEIQSCLKELMQ